MLIYINEKIITKLILIFIFGFFYRFGYLFSHYQRLIKKIKTASEKILLKVHNEIK